LWPAEGTPRVHIQSDAVGIPTSSLFVLAGRGPEVNLDVKAGSNGLRVGGIAATSVGGAALGVGIIVVAMASLQSSTPALDGNTYLVNDHQSMQIGGGVTAGLGVAALVGGIVMIWQGRTRTTFVSPGQEGRSALRFAF
jgi:hypothetical protein